MPYIHNDSILVMKRVFKESLTVTYRLFESTLDYRTSYSVLVSMQSEDGTEEDYFISDLTNNRMGALVLFDKLYKNTVLPAEVEEIYSDGFSEIL
ncbi:MAG: hypothetical protein IJX27_06875 [Clostridia bacterium]|nr:hypothetical protein [Clostridia bacterium]